MIFPKWKKIKKDKNTEYFIYKEYTWIINKLLEIIEERKIKKITFPKDQINELLKNSLIDEEYAMETDRTDPIIVIEVANKELLLVDGNHRAYRDIKNGKNEIEGYKISNLLQPLALDNQHMYNNMINKIKESISK